MSSHFQSSAATTDVLPTSTCFASPPSSDEADQITFPFGMHDKEYTLISAGPSYSDMNIQLEYDKPNSGYATPMTSSSDGDYPGKTVLATGSSDSTTSVAVSEAGNSATETNSSQESIAKPKQNGLKRTASQAFLPNGTQDVPDVGTSKQNPSEPSSSNSNSTSVKPAENNFDTLNATIESVALREGNLARIRKEAEEASAALPIEQQLQPHAKRPRVASPPPPAANTNAIQSQSHADPSPAQRPPEVAVFNEPQPSTSAVSYGPVDPIDTATAVSTAASTPLATPASKTTESKEETKPEGKGKKPKKEKLTSCSCNFVDPEKKTACKQRSILRYKFCIRHILSDETAPYKRCQYRKVANNKPDDPGKECTNAIPKEATEIYCTTHLIMMGVKQPKKKKKKPGADDSTVSVDGSDRDHYLDSVMTNGSNQFGEDFSMPSFPDNDDRSTHIGNSRPPTASMNGFDQPPSRTSTAEHWAQTPQSHGGTNGYQMMDAQPLDMGYDPSQPGPSTAYYGNMEPLMPMQPQQQPQQQPQMHPQQQQQQNIVYHPPPPTTIQQEFSRYEGPAPSVPMQQTQMLPPPMPMPPPPQVTLTLTQNANGEPILVDENNVEQPPGSYTLIQNPDGTLAASFHNLDHRQGELTPDSGFPSSTPPESAPPMFSEDPRRQLFHSQSVDGSKTYDPLSFPPSQAPSVTHTPQPQSAPVQFGDVSRQHPQLSARLMQPSVSNNHQQPHQQQFSSHNNNDTFMEPAPTMGPPGNLHYQQPYAARPPTGDNVIYVDPTCNPEMPPPPLPQQSQTQSRSSSTRSNQVAPVPEPQYCAVVTYENGDIHVLPEGTKIIENADGTTSIITPPGVLLPPGKPVSVAHAQVVNTPMAPEPQPEVIVEQVVEVPPPQPPPAPINPDNLPISTKAPYPFLPHERPPKYAKVDIDADDEDEAERLLRDYIAQDTEPPRRNKTIKLYQKRQRMRIGGSYRKIPVVDEMCRTLEDYDFDGTDFFPLGLEPSDDDEWSDDEDKVFPPRMSGLNRVMGPQIEMFLSKKQLKLEKHRLKQNAAACGPMMAAALPFPNSAGAALATRHHYRRGLTLPETKPLRERRCYHMQSVSHGSLMEHRSLRCPKPCLPRTNHCSDHIQHNIDQDLYEDCLVPDCERPLLPTEAMLTNGLCRQHYDQEVARKEAEEAEAALAEQAAKEEKMEYMMQMGQMDGMPMMAGEPGGLDTYLMSNGGMDGYHDQIMPMAQDMLQQPYIQQHSIMDPGHDMPFQDQQMLYGNSPMHQMTVMSSETVTTNSNGGMRPYPTPSNHFDDANGFYGEQGFDSSAEGMTISEELTLASVVKDLGIDTEDFNEVLAQADELHCGSEVLDEFPLGKDPSLSLHNHHSNTHSSLLHPSQPNLDNSWEDIHSFLEAEGHPCSRQRMLDAGLHHRNTPNFMDGLRRDGPYMDNLRRDNSIASNIMTPTTPTANGSFHASSSNGNNGFDTLMYDLS
uniref:NSL complex protein NSL2 n=1 Tax=Panagrellus redivivus TaxID=6233 RepID=A0A7E4VNS5_PANRE